MADSLIDMFGGTIETLSRSLDLRSCNHEMILNNVANADTPKYKPFALNVEKALQKLPVNEPRPMLDRTDAQHLAGNDGAVFHPTENSRSVQEEALLFRGDQNGVDIDEEMTALAKNSLLYRAATQMVAAKFKGLKYALTGGSK